MLVQRSLLYSFGASDSDFSPFAWLCRWLGYWCPTFICVRSSSIKSPGEPFAFFCLSFFLNISPSGPVILCCGCFSIGILCLILLPFLIQCLRIKCCFWRALAPFCKLSRVFFFLWPALASPAELSWFLYRVLVFFYSAYFIVALSV